MMKKYLFVGLLACGILSLAGCTEDKTNTEKKVEEVKMVKIGVIAPMSGDSAVLGAELKKVLDYRLAELNTKAPIKLELDYEDGKCNAEQAEQAFHKLNDVGGVKFILGGFCSAESLAIAPLLKDAGVVALSSWSDDAEIEGKSPKLFTLAYNKTLFDAPVITNKEFLAYLDKMMVEKGGKLDNLGSFYAATAVDALDIMSKLVLDNNGDVTSVQKGLSTGSFEGKMGKIVFGGKSFVQGIGIAKVAISEDKKNIK